MRYIGCLIMVNGENKKQVSEISIIEPQRQENRRSRLCPNQPPWDTPSKKEPQ